MSLLSSKWQAGAQYYLFGRRYFTSSGSRSGLKKVQADMETISLSGRTVLIAGEAIMTEELACVAASKGARIVLICTSRERALKIQQRVCATAGTLQVEFLVADLSLVAEAERAIAELQEKLGCKRFDCVVVNMDVDSASGITAERQLTVEGHEAMFARFMLGPFTLVQAALPLLEAAADCSRVVLVSAGVMYTTAFPPWEVASGLKGEYHPVAAHAFARRGQVLMAEGWARRLPRICVVSCIPGWVRSQAVELLASESSRARMEPFRSAAEGASGVAWLMSVRRDQLRSGAFYLDGAPQPTHLAGAFFTEGYVTKNTPAEVDEMMRALEALATIRRLPSSLAVPVAAPGAPPSAVERA